MSLERNIFEEPYETAIEVQTYQTTVNAYINRGFTRLDLADDNGRQDALEKFGPKFGVIVFYLGRLPRIPTSEKYRQVWVRELQDRFFDIKESGTPVEKRFAEDAFREHINITLNNY